MNRSTLFRIIIFVCLACLHTLMIPVQGDAKTDSKRPAKKKASKAEPGQFVSIIVNGRPLSGPNSAAQRQGGMILMPIVSLARVLGDTVTVDADARTIKVQRQTGISADLDTRLGQVRENGSTVLSVSNTSELIFTPNADQMFLPVEIAAALFDAAIRYDDAQNAVIVTRGGAQLDAISSKSTWSFAELYKVDYDYSLNRYSSFTSHNLILNATGRLADGRFNFLANSSTTKERRISPRNVNFTFERPNGQKYTAGDLGTGTALQFMAANVRGGMAAIPFKNVTFTAFGGRANSGTIVAQPIITPDGEPQLPVRVQSRFDTNIFGFYATQTSTPSSFHPSPLTLSAGVLSFSGPAKSGEFVTTSANYGGRRFRLQGDFGFGKFKGIGYDDQRVNGTGTALDVSGTFQVTDALAVQGRYAYISRNFLSPQTGLRDPMDLKAAGVTWSPKKWLSTSFNASTIKRPGDTAKRDSFVTAALIITPDGTGTRLYLSHTQSSNSQIKSAAFTLFNASKDFSRWRLYVNATRIKTLGPASMNAQAGANFKVNDQQSIEVSQGIGSHRTLNGQVDWRTSGLGSKHLSFSAGMGYSYGQNSKFTAYERVTASLNLPRQSSLQVSYMNSNAGPTLLVSVRGTLFRKKEAAAYLGASISEANSFAAVRGRVYQDVNLNGRFDEGVDQPQADVKVRVDGNRYVVSDATGMFSFDSVMAGDHKVSLDLLSVRADLTLLSGDARQSALKAGSESTIDFRLVRTGRLRGHVWLDANENGKFDEGEQPLADVRVLTGSGRDTLTDADGYFVIADLAPGEHVVLIDEKTIPEKTKSGFKPMTLQVFPGRETAEVDLNVLMIPADVKHFGSKP